MRSTGSDSGFCLVLAATCRTATYYRVLPQWSTVTKGNGTIPFKPSGRECGRPETRLTREKRQAFRNRAIISENTTSRTLQSLSDESTEQLATHPLQDCRRCPLTGGLVRLSTPSTQ